MSVRPKTKLYLVHQETGQRYPIDDEVVIGRTSGDILFPEDGKLSGQHARVIVTPKGLAVHDLESSNGTTLDGVKLDPKKMYIFKPGNLLEVGQQAMKLQEPPAPRNLARRSSRRKKGGFDLSMIFVIALVLGAIGIYWKVFLQPGSEKTAEFKGDLQSPLDIVEREMRQAFFEYAETGKKHTAGKVSDRELSHAIRVRLIPRLNAARVKMEVLRPQNEWERRKIEANIKLLTALVKQVTAIASFTETRVAKYGRDIEIYSAEVEEINAEVQRLDEARKPASGP